MLRSLKFEPLEPRLVLGGQGPVISELMAINTGSPNDSMADADGDYPDWIEIHNPTQTAIELDGWYLSDDDGDRTKWRFPDLGTPGAEVRLDPGDYLVVFASGKDRLDPAELHTNFQLNGDGEYLALIEPDGITVAHEYSPEFPEQYEDISYGITQDVTTFVPDGAEMSYRVPTSGDAGANWTDPGYDDSGWVDALGTGISGLMITEIDNRGTDFVEIQNVWDREIDTSGWIVAVNDGLSGNISAVNPVVWSLPAQFPARQVSYRTDNSGDNYWGSDIRWDSDRGWAMIVDDNGKVADFLPWGYTASQIDSLSVDVGGFSNITIGSQWSGDSPTGLTNGWQTGNPGIDIGNPGRAGSHSYDPGTGRYTLNGGGSDIWSNSDQFHYLYQSLSGDSEVIARVLSVENTNQWAKAGVMIRESLSANSKHAMVVVTPGNGVSFQYRSFTGGSSGHFTNGGLSAPYWVKLVRQGNEFRGYRSSDGANWEPMGSQTISMASTVYVGLAVTSHNNSTICTAQFENVAVGVSAPPEMLQRTGNLDRNTAADFSVPTTQSKGTQNADLIVPFPGSEQVPVRTGVGFNLNPTGFDVTTYKANVAVTSLSAAENVISDPARQAWTATEIADVVNYYNTGADGHFGGNRAFPGTTIGSNVDEFVVEVTSTVLIPSAGQWTFGVNSDDGFGLELTGGGDTFSTSFPGLRAPADTFATFDISQPGGYELRLVAFEHGGGAGVELFAAQGSYSTFNSEFAMVGDVASGGLMVTGFGGAIRTDIEQEMHNQNASLWMRIPFEAEDPASLDSLRLRIKYNDGFVAYLGGQEIARRNAPGSLQWNSSATAARPNEDSAVFEEINVTAAASRLVAGRNVLAIHGLNVTAADDDFLILPVLVGSHTGDVERYFETATPGGPNGTGFVDFVADTQFSADRGFYDEPLMLEITTDTPGATIRYTLDGSEPTESGQALTYSGPLLINKTTTLRAAAFKTDYHPTNIDTQTYIFLDDVLTQSGAAPPGWPSGSVNGQSLQYGMDPAIVNSPVWGPQMKAALTSIPTMSLVTDLDNLFDPGSGIYVNARSDGIDWERPASLELFYPEGASGAGFPDGADEGFQIDMGVRIRGGFSRSGGNPKHAFRFFFRREYGDGKLNYPLFGDEGVASFDKVDLRTSQNYSWAFQNSSANTMNRDVTARDTQGAMDQPYTRSRYYHLYINGQYWGLFQTQERSEAAYGASYFGGDREDYDTIKVGDGYNIHATDGNMDAWQDVWNLARAGFETDAKYYYIQGRNPDGTRNPNYPVLIDVDNLIDYMLIVFYDGDRDAPISNFLGNNSPNNWYGVRNRNGEEGFKFFVHDAEHIYSRGLTDRTGPFPAGDTFNKSNPQWVHQELMAHPDYRMRFADRAHKQLFNDGNLTQQSVTGRFLDRAAQIDLAIIAESARWGSSSLNKNTWQSAINNEVNNFFPTRSQVIVNQLRRTRLRNGTLAPLYPGVDAPWFNQHGGLVDAGFELLMTAPSPTIWYTLDGSDPRMPDGSVRPGAEIFNSSSTQTTLIPRGASWKYLDNGSDQGTAWRNPGFNDGGWASGPAQLGYGDGDEATRVSYGPSSSNKYITTYFRRTFSAVGVEDIDQLTMQILRDDGAVVYLNGQEVARTHMPAGSINYQTRAASPAVGGAEEDTFFSFSLDPGVLVEGTNVIAVEIHQVSPTSSDISFDLKLDAVSVSVTDPIVLSESTLVMARVKSGSQWSALSEAQFYVGVPAGAENLAVSELNYHPYEPTPAEEAAGFVDKDAFEFVELKNISDDVIDLTGVKFTFGIQFDFAGSDVTRLGPGEFVVVVSDLPAFSARYATGGLPIAGEYSGRLGNGGERIQLRGFSGETILNFEYDDTGSWPGRADGKGASLELIDPENLPARDPSRTLFLENGDNWRGSSEYGGSPGAAGTGPIGDVVVNEVLSHTDLPDLDTIELHNTTAAAIDIGGWYLSDDWGWDPTGIDGNYKRFRIPSGTSIPAGGYVVFDEDDFNPGGGGLPTDFALNGAHGDDVWLLEADATGKLTRFVDHAEFDAAANGESWGRWPNGQGDLYPMLYPTLDPEDGENSGPRVGPVIISEVHYNPDSGNEDGDLEFIEIYNATDQAIDLANWRIRGGIAYDFPAAASLDAYSPLIVVPFPLGDTQKLTAFYDAYWPGGQVPGDLAIFGGYSGQLSDEGERVRLQRPDEEPFDEPGFFPRLLEDEVRYEIEPPWPTSPNGEGDSLSRTQTDAWGNSDASWEAAPPTPAATSFVVLPDAQVVGRHVFYNDSRFDGNDPSASAADDSAIAPDKVALLPGFPSGGDRNDPLPNGRATFANYTSYSRGINGIMIDIEGVQEFAVPDSGDFQFRAGNSNNPSNWSPAPSPSMITLRPGEGVGGSDRITLIWPDGDIQKQWLQVTVLATQTTNLAEDDVFYFGNAIGETGDSTVDAKVTVFDMLGARDNQRSFLNPAPIDFPHDFNRDGRVNSYDMLIARDNQTHFLNALKLITVPAAKAGQDVTAGDVGPADDAVFGQAFRSESGLRGISPGRITWVYEFAQIGAQDRQPANRNPSERAVDTTLATYWA